MDLSWLHKFVAIASTLDNESHIRKIEYVTITDNNINTTLKELAEGQDRAEW